MADPLASARLKLKRANLHAATFNREAQRFLRAHDEPTFRGQFEANFTRYMLYVRTGYPDPPDSFAVRFGDAIYNYRCDNHPKRPTFVQFPIYSRRKDFNRQIGSRLPGVYPDALKLIKGRNAKPSWNSPHNVLLHLADLSNEDKHRNVQLVTAGLHDIWTRAWAYDCINLGMLPQMRKPPRLKEGARVCGYITKQTGPNPHMGVEAEIKATVGLKSGLVAGLVLLDVRREVKFILNAREIRAALA